MAAFNFPNSPSVNDLHTENGVTFKWNGTMWNRFGPAYTDTANLNVTGIGTIAGNLNVGGVLTYEDVKNVDSIGIVTARSGLIVGTAVTISSVGNITLDKPGAGIITATKYYGDGSTLTNVTSTTINNNANNRLITGSGTANTLEAEATLTYDGTILEVSNATPKLKLTDSDATGTPEALVDGSGGDLILDVDKDNEKGSTLFAVKLDGSEKLRITSSGLMGLGTNSPSDALEISHASDPAIRLHYGSNSGYSVISIDSANNLTLDVDAANAGSNSIFNVKIDGSEKFRINSSGNMGLGDLSNVSNTPQTLLHIANTSPTFRIQDTTNDFYAHISSDDGGNLILDADAGNGAGSSYMLFKTDGSEKVRIKSDGTLSVKCNGNSRGLELNIGSGAGSLVLDRNGHITSFIRASDGGSNVAGGSGGGSRMRLGKTQIQFDTFPYTTNVGDAPTYTERLRIASNGDVKVTSRGSSTSGAPFYVAVTGKSSITYSGGNDDTACLRIVDNGSTNSYYHGIELRTRQGGDVRLYAQDQGNDVSDFVIATDNSSLIERFRIKAAGQAYFKETVGIQTNDVTRANLANPVGAGHSLVGMYIGDGSLLFNNTLNRTGGYYISTETNALNAGPVTLVSNMKVDGAWVIV